ncbi:MAG: glutamate synthase large subunit [Candidatus Omnitrophica bacterium]|nr:glutamate synthase large subunit [Candidatus Omnitrophota bacterium]
MEDIAMRYDYLPQKQGLYDPAFEHDSCGVGFVCDVKGRRSRAIVKQALEVLRRLSHRGAVGSDPKTGDGAGILIQTPHEFLKKACDNAGIDLPRYGDYAAGLVFLPADSKERDLCKDTFSKIAGEEGQSILGWRGVPVDDSDIGKGARQAQPIIEQVFIERNKNIKEQLAFERNLYVIRKRIENAVRGSGLKQKSFFYVTNLSSRTLSYKGLLMPQQLDSFFPDLKDDSLSSGIAVVHSRYSTNTFPTWDLAQPFRFLAHNGEINTLRGNFNWMKAREGLLKSGLFGKDIEKIKPVLISGQSDSATIDNAFELLVLAGRPLAQAMMMLIPAAWENNPLLDDKLKDFYKYHACIMEPWDGPAAIAFSDGLRVGAVLDRNGLRPARYIITRHDSVVMASEAGVLDIKPQDILVSGRLEPGKMLYIDTLEGRIVSDDELKRSIAVKRPFGAWLKDNIVELRQEPRAKRDKREKEGTLTLMKAFAYTREDLKVIIKPMAEKGDEPTGSMGNDTPLAVLSKRPQPLYNYFKQLFAQVTNPAIDPIREKCVMSLEGLIGPQGNLLDETPAHCRKLKVDEPILTNEELEKIRHIKNNGFKTKTISLLFKTDKKGDFLKTLDRVCKDASSAIKEGYSFIILSDRGVSKDRAALPALLAMGAVHHYLVREEMRAQIGIIVESGSAREVHHFALLFGYGADCVNPYLAYDAVKYIIAEGELDSDHVSAIGNYRKAAHKGILKILSKMGISTLQSYRGAQIFEVLGLNDEVVDRCFCGTASRIGGAGFDVIEKEALMAHEDAFSNKPIEAPFLSSGGLYQWKRDGEFHLWNPDSIAALQDASRKGDYGKYKEFARLINDQSADPATLRGLLKFKKQKPVPVDEVEPLESIVKRFATGAMSFGSISRAAHETLAIAMNGLGAKSNTGEGGEDPARFLPLPNGGSRRSAIKQVASGRFGVTTNYLVNADELQIKIAQGAKPGEGGQLPGHKVSVSIAKTRYTTPGVTLISPPPHHDIYSIEDLAQLIFDLKNANPRARISVKLVSEAGVGTVAAGVAKGHADMILISGGDGGTGASPISSIRHAGLPWELGLSEAHQTLILNGLRSRVRLQADGQMRTGKDAAVAALLGAEEFGFCTSALIVLGCVMLRHCHLNNCSVGVATQDEVLEKRFSGRPEYIVNYFRFVAQELREIMAQLGLRRVDDMIGRSDLLQVDAGIIPWKAKQIDYAKILYRPNVSESAGMYCEVKQDHKIDKVLDRELIKLAGPALEHRQPVKQELAISNVNRATGAMLSGEVCRAFGEQGLPGDTIHFKFRGVAGQSFGAWLAEGLTFELEGMANDYVGKGISGGRIIIYPDRNSNYDPRDSIVMGNTTFYGAIKGEAYIKGAAGERFCIRNSGLYAVVEGVGDHGCEYMTGGRVVILGGTGRNFAAGMSGGIAYVYDEEGAFRNKCNMNMVELERTGDGDKETLYNLIHNHYKYTQSRAARAILDDFEASLGRFVKVMPIEYKRILEGAKVEEKLGLAEASDG